MSSELGIVIPILEESDILEEFLVSLALTLIRNSILAEVTVVAVEDSLHLNEEKYQDLHKKYLLNLNCLTTNNNSRDYGRVIRTGIANVDSRYVLVVTPDLISNLILIPNMLNSCRNGSALTIVNRFSRVNVTDKPKSDEIMQTIFRKITEFIIGGSLPIDSTFSLRIFLKSTYECLSVSGNSWDVFSEQTVKTVLSGEKVTNIDGFQGAELKSFKFSYTKNIWGYLRVAIRALLHRLGLSWF